MGFINKMKIFIKIISSLRQNNILFKRFIFTVRTKGIKIAIKKAESKMLLNSNGLLFTLKQLYNNKYYKSNPITFKKGWIDLQEVNKTIEDTLSIIIPTYNGFSNLVKLIPQLLNQKGFKHIEIIIIDSSSSDNTKSFIEKFPSIKFVTIKQKDFSHSYARNLGYENSNGNYVLFLVQDALPSSNLWLYNFLHIMIENELSALSCSQVVNIEADLYTCFGIDMFNEFLELKEKRTKITEKYVDDIRFSRKLAQLDNVACLFKAVDFQQYKFRGKYAEDLDIGLRLIQNNKRIGMTSEISVIHSHLRPAYYYMKRAIVETEVVNNIFKQNSNGIVIVEDELSDILSTFCLIGGLFVEINKLTKFPIIFEEFNRYVIQNLKKHIGIE